MGMARYEEPYDGQVARFANPDSAKVPFLGCAGDYLCRDAGWGILRTQNLTRDGVRLCPAFLDTILWRNLRGLSQHQSAIGHLGGMTEARGLQRGAVSYAMSSRATDKMSGHGPVAVHAVLGLAD